METKSTHPIDDCHSLHQALATFFRLKLEDGIIEIQSDDVSGEVLLARGKIIRAIIADTGERGEVAVRKLFAAEPCRCHFFEIDDDIANATFEFEVGLQALFDVAEEYAKDPAEEVGKCRSLQDALSVLHHLGLTNGIIQIENDEWAGEVVLFGGNIIRATNLSTGGHGKDTIRQLFQMDNCTCQYLAQEDLSECTYEFEVGLNSLFSLEQAAAHALEHDAARELEEQAARELEEQAARQREEQAARERDQEAAQKQDEDESQYSEHASQTEETPIQDFPEESFGEAMVTFEVETLQFSVPVAPPQQVQEKAAQENEADQNSALEMLAQEDDEESLTDTEEYDEDAGSPMLDVHASIAFCNTLQQALAAFFRGKLSDGILDIFADDLTGEIVISGGIIIRAAIKPTGERGKRAIRKLFALENCRCEYRAPNFDEATFEFEVGLHDLFADEDFNLKPETPDEAPRKRSRNKAAQQAAAASTAPAAKTEAKEEPEVASRPTASSSQPAKAEPASAPGGPADELIAATHAALERCTTVQQALAAFFRSGLQDGIIRIFCETLEGEIVIAKGTIIRAALKPGNDRGPQAIRKLFDLDPCRCLFEPIGDISEATFEFEVGLTELFADDDFNLVPETKAEEPPTPKPAPPVREPVEVTPELIASTHAAIESCTNLQQALQKFFRTGMPEGVIHVFAESLEAEIVIFDGRIIRAAIQPTHETGKQAIRKLFPLDPCRCLFELRDDISEATFEFEVGLHDLFADDNYNLVPEAPPMPKAGYSITGAMTGSTQVNQPAQPQTPRLSEAEQRLLDSMLAVRKSRDIHCDESLTPAQIRLLQVAANLMSDDEVFAQKAIVDLNDDTSLTDQQKIELQRIAKVFTNRKEFEVETGTLRQEGLVFMEEQLTMLYKALYQLTAEEQEMQFAERDAQLQTPEKPELREFVEPPKEEISLDDIPTPPTPTVLPEDYRPVDTVATPGPGYRLDPSKSNAEVQTFKRPVKKPSKLTKVAAPLAVACLCIGVYVFPAIIRQSAGRDGSEIADRQMRRMVKSELDRESVNAAQETHATKPFSLPKGEQSGSAPITDGGPTPSDDTVPAAVKEARAAISSGNPDKAIEVLETSLSVEPLNAPVRIELIKLYKARKNFHRAKELAVVGFKNGNCKPEEHQMFWKLFMECVTEAATQPAEKAKQAQQQAPVQQLHDQPSDQQ